MGEVYFLLAEKLGLVKIGTSTSSPARLRALATASPDRLILIGLISSEDARALEQRLHIRFYRDRSHGEWFRRSPRIDACIRSNSMGKSSPRFVEAKAALDDVFARSAAWRELSAMPKTAANENNPATEVGCAPVG